MSLLIQLRFQQRHCKHASYASRVSRSYAWMRNKAMELTLRPGSSNCNYPGLAWLSGDSFWPDILVIWTGTSGFWIWSKCLEYVNLRVETGLPFSSLHHFGTYKFMFTLRKPSRRFYFRFVLVIPGIQWKSSRSDCRCSLGTHSSLWYHTHSKASAKLKLLLEGGCWLTFTDVHCSHTRGDHTYRVFPSLAQPCGPLTSTSYCQQHIISLNFIFLRWHMNN